MKRVFLRLLAAAIGAIFIYAGALKALDPAQFALDIQNYRLVPWIIAALTALYLPWLEIACGAALLIGRASRGALWLVTAMVLVFIGALVSAKARGLDISCGCFGHASGARGFAMPLARDLAILAALAMLLCVEQRKDKVLSVE
jgi:putative oxidoreductase